MAPNNRPEEHETAAEAGPAVSAASAQSTRDFFAATRAELRRAIEDARSRVMPRHTVPGIPVSARENARAAVAEMRDRARARVRGTQGPAEASAETLSLADLHGLERVLSHVRHSVVRICFYNLKLFCPSLADEYDAEVRAQVLTNIDQLDAVERELDSFFGAVLSGGRTVGNHFPAAQREVAAALRELRDACAMVRGELDHEAARTAFAKSGPQLVDRVMDGLGGIQAELDAHKVALSEMLDEVLALHQPQLAEAGITAKRDTAATPKVIADKEALANAFGEIVTNTVKYAHADTLHVDIRPSEDRLWANVTLMDNGKGIRSDIAETCTQRGVSTGGTGEGLAMVREIIEAEHLGRLTVENGKAGGCRVTMRLPVKLQLGERAE
ncbi:MAG: ATP-binding protein [Candidatus Hydrogenedentota bacterium]